jgi:hypothetical protein
VATPVRNQKLTGMMNLHYATRGVLDFTACRYFDAGLRLYAIPLQVARHARAHLRCFYSARAQFGFSVCAVTCVCVRMYVCVCVFCM